jgi:DNA-binding XRE family transcriptional regulator
MGRYRVVDRYEEIFKLKDFKSSYVYIMVNDSIPRMLKIGATSNVYSRLGTIQGVLPGKTRCVWFIQVDDMFEVESKARERLNKFRAECSKDWFCCPVHIAVREFDQVLRNLEHKQVGKIRLRDNLVKIVNLKDLGRYCREWRKSHKMSIADVSDLTGVGIRFISEFERGKPTCQFDLCLKMCEHMGVDVFASRR